MRQGALVLAPRTYELTPTFSWAHWDKVQEPLIENSFSAGASFTMGLPWRSQISLGVPYVWDDLRNGEQLARPGRRRCAVLEGVDQRGPRLCQRCSARLAGPRRQAGPAAWANPLCLRLPRRPDRLKRLDPLVAFAGVSYFSQISGDVAGTTFDPDIIGTRLGASLAVTPATSITTGINLSFITNPSRKPTGPQA